MITIKAKQKRLNSAVRKNINLTNHHNDFLNKVAKKLKVSVSEIVRQLIDQFEEDYERQAYT